jgi:uncharacterized DUF497 family protein
MDYEYDVDKDRENRRKHGLPLILGRAAIESMISEKIDLDSGDEERWVAYGFASGRLMVCVYTVRESSYRLISVRRATRREERECLL